MAHLSRISFLYCYTNHSSQILEVVVNRAFVYLLTIRFYFKNAKYREDGVHLFRKKWHIGNMVSVLKYFRRVGYLLKVNSAHVCMHLILCAF